MSNFCSMENRYRDVGPEPGFHRGLIYGALIMALLVAAVALIIGLVL